MSLPLPERPSLIQEAIGSLRTGILTGHWTTYLPAERLLCEQLQISRPSLRRALTELAAEGLVEIRHGRKTRILHTATATPPPGSSVDTLILLSLRRVVHTAGILILRECETAFRRAGFSVENRQPPFPHSRERLALLRESICQRRDAIWLLVNANREEQMLFQETGARALVFGCAHEGITLPSIDLHYHAIAAHAIRTFYRLGHRHLHALLPDQPLAGDLLTERGIHDTLRELPDLHYTASHTDGTPESLHRIVTRLLRMRPLPTALFVTRGINAITLLTALSRHGIDIPRSLSMISRDDEEALRYTVPAIAAYDSKHEAVIRSLVRKVRTLSRTATLLIPDLQPRQTLAVAEKSSPGASINTPHAHRSGRT